MSLIKKLRGEDLFNVDLSGGKKLPDRRLTVSLEGTGDDLYLKVASAGSLRFVVGRHGEVYIDIERKGNT